MVDRGGRCWRIWDKRTRRIRLRAERRIPDTLATKQVAAIVAACARLRDRFLFSLGYIRAAGW